MLPTPSFWKPSGHFIAASPELQFLLWAGLGLGFALWPAPAWANSGTALLWAGLIHLFIGNLVIGYIEGGVLSRLFHTPRGLSTGVLILANYTSAWAGMLLLGGRLSRQPDVTLENVQIWLGIFAILAFLLTLVIEYPCFWWLLRQRQRSWQTALKATLLIHGISYLLLFGWYSLSSQTSLLTQLSVVPAAQLQPSDSYTLYYLNPEGTQALRSDLTGANPVAIAQTDFEAVAPETPQVFGPVPRLAATTDWDYYTSVFAGGGFSGINRTTRESVHFALETPFALWSISHATHLTGDLVVFQLGRDQICLLHPPTQRLALVARGKNPVVTHPHGGPPSPPSSL